jgi:transcriptional regulator with XRE-family HTH domain
VGAARVNSFSGPRLRAAREHAGLTQVALAARLGGRTQKQTVWRWENGLRKPSPETLRDMAAVLGVHPIDLTDAGAAPTLAVLRQVAGLTQDQAGAGVGLSVDQWALLEHGRGQIEPFAEFASRMLGVPAAAVVDAHRRSRNCA